MAGALREKVSVLVFGVSLVFVLIGISYYVVVERKCLGHVQRRSGPNKPSVAGLLLPLGDGLKLILNEVSVPSVADSGLFLCGPLLLFVCYFILWVVYPISCSYVFYYYSGLFFLCVSSLSVFGFVACGWGCGSSYGLLGGMRAVAQSISYEVVFSGALFCPLIFVGSFELWSARYSGVAFFAFMPEVVVVWLISCLAESNRLPFDFVEGESELVSGYIVEYGGAGFVLVVLSEYSSVIFVSVVSSCVFFGGGFGGVLWDSVFVVVSVLVSMLFIFVRSAYPRYRYDKLMEFCWKVLLPVVSVELLFCVVLSV